jgi:hypothetical protein
MIPVGLAGPHQAVDLSIAENSRLGGHDDHRLMQPPAKI